MSGDWITITDYGHGCDRTAQTLYSADLKIKTARVRKGCCWVDSMGKAHQLPDVRERVE